VDRHVEYGASASGVRADAVATDLVAQVSNAAETDVHLLGLDGEAGLKQTRQDNGDVVDVFSEIEARGLGDQVIDVTQNQGGGETNENLVDEALEGGGRSSEALSHALELKEPKASAKSGLLFGGLVQLDLVETREEVEGSEPVATALGEVVDDIGQRVVVLDRDAVQGAKVDNEPIRAILLPNQHRARAKGAAAGRDQLGLDTLIDELA